jgi:hypothetical protein
MTPWVVMYAAVAVNAWVASTLFHSKKTKTFILYDYGSALAFLTAGLFVAIRRCLGPKVPPLVPLVTLAVLLAGFCVRLDAMMRGT